MQFTTTPQDLLNAASICKNTNNQIQGQIQQVKNYIDGLMATYQGPAAIQLGIVSERWHKDALNLNNALTEIASNLTYCAHNYGRSEEINVSNLGRVGAALPPVNL
jgi:WXG100 family type VII secretion target